jgi:hypothetical protein
MGVSMMKTMFKVLIVVLIGWSIVGCTKSYEVTFETNGGTEIDAMIVDGQSKINRPKDPEKLGHTFLGWFDSTLSEAFDFEEMMIRSDITLYAKWEVNLYSISYVDHNGTPLLVVTAPYGSSVSVGNIQIPERIGYVTLGWSQVPPAIMPAYHVVITPNYTPYAYELILNSLGSDMENSIEITFGQTVTLPVLTHPDLSFVGWKDAGSEETITTYTHLFYGDTRLYSVWSYEQDDVIYHLNFGFAVVHEYQGDQTELIIPDLVFGYPVVMIDHNAFRNNQTLIHVTLADGILSVGDYAFSYMTALEKIVMGEETAFFGDYVFYQSNAIQSMVISSKILTTLTALFGGLIFDIPSSLQTIQFTSNDDGYSAHFMVTLPNLNITVVLGSSLQKIDTSMFLNSQVNHLMIPKSVLSIDRLAFMGLQNLKSVTFEEGSLLNSIGENAFLGTALETIEIPEHVTWIDPSAFRLTPVLSHIDVHPDNRYYTAVDGVLYAKDMTVLYRFPASKISETFSVPDTVETIESYAFYGAYAISSIQFSSFATLKTIKNDVFIGMYNLEHLEIPEGVTSIGRRLYSDHMKLSFVVIPSTVKTMLAPAFPNYMLVKHAIYMKASEPGENFELGWDQTRFSIVFNFQEFFIHEDILYALKTDGTAVLMDAEGARSNTELIIPEVVGTHTVTEVAAFAFTLLAELKSVRLPLTIERIGHSAFALCQLLDEINIDELTQLKRIDAYAFQKTQMTDVVLPHQLTSIGAFAFKDMDALKTLYIPMSVTWVEGGIVEGSELVEIRLERTEVPTSWFGMWNYESRPVVFGYILTE